MLCEAVSWLGAVTFQEEMEIVWTTIPIKPQNVSIKHADSSEMTPYSHLGEGNNGNMGSMRLSCHGLNACKINIMYSEFFFFVLFFSRIQNDCAEFSRVSVRG